MTFCLGSLVVVAGRARGQPGGHGPGAGLLGHAVVADDGVEPAPGVGILCRVVGVQRGGDAALVLGRGKQEKKQSDATGFHRLLLRSLQLPLGALGMHQAGLGLPNLLLWAMPVAAGLSRAGSGAVERGWHWFTAVPTHAGNGAGPGRAGLAERLCSCAGPKALASINPQTGRGRKSCLVLLCLECYPDLWDEHLAGDGRTRGPMGQLLAQDHVWIWF